MTNPLTDDEIRAECDHDILMFNALHKTVPCPYCHIKKLEAQIERVLAIGYTTHASWGCSQEFSDGWKECRKQVDESMKLEKSTD